MSRPTAAMIVVGDEILSGRTRDSNMHHLAGRLTAHGIDLAEVRVVSDRKDAIVAAVRALAQAHDHVFTSGGIGPTHDDVTADAVAAALDLPIGVRDDARRILAERYDAMGIELNDARLRMARIPEGATLIENPVSAAPGFSAGNVHVMAGVPKIFEAMVAGLLPRLSGGAPLVSRTLLVQRGGDVALALDAAQAAHPHLSVGSYPSQRPDGAFEVRVVVRGPDADELDAVLAALRDELGTGECLPEGHPG